MAYFSPLPRARSRLIHTIFQYNTNYDINYRNFIGKKTRKKKGENKLVPVWKY